MRADAPTVGDFHVYRIYLSHHSLRDEGFNYAGTLQGAKAAATKRYGGGFNEHIVVISDVLDGYVYAERRLDERLWR